jgi:hypothetical protein
MSPPFRNKQHQDSLWAGLMSGSLSVVATDHCAFTTEQKRYGVGDFTKIPNGTGGLEDRIADALDPWRAHGAADDERVRRGHVNEHRQDPELLPEKGCDPGRRGCRYRGLGPEKSKTITAGSQQSAIDYNVFEGKEVTGLPRFTLTRARLLSMMARSAPRKGTASSSSAGAGRDGEQGAVDLEGPDRADAGAADGHTGDRRVSRASRVESICCGVFVMRRHAPKRGTFAAWLLIIQPDAPGAMPVIEARGLDLTFQTADGPVQALRDVNLIR